MFRPRRRWPVTRVAPPRCAASSSRLLAHGLSGPYVLCPSGSHPRKNNEALVAAWAAVRPELRAARQLVITGELDEPTRRHYSVLASSLGADAGVVTTGHVPDELLVRLYQGAELVCYASLAEGANLPLAEAFACGAAVIASDRPPLNELVSPEGRFDPTDEGAITRSLERALSDEGLRSRLAEPAMPLDNWRDVAARSAAAFEEILGRSGSGRVVHDRAPLRRRRPRIAFVSPLPPAPSGVAGYSYALIEALRADREGGDRRLPRRAHRGTDRPRRRRSLERGGARGDRIPDGPVRPCRLRTRQQPPSPRRTRRAPQPAGHGARARRQAVQPLPPRVRGERPNPRRLRTSGPLDVPRFAPRGTRRWRRAGRIRRRALRRPHGSGDNRTLRAIPCHLRRRGVARAPRRRSRIRRFEWMCCPSLVAPPLATRRILRRTATASRTESTRPSAEPGGRVPTRRTGAK